MVVLIFEGQYFPPRHLLVTLEKLKLSIIRYLNLISSLYVMLYLIMCVDFVTNTMSQDVIKSLSDYSVEECQMVSKRDS